jgi:hypothetical protein
VIAPGRRKIVLLGMMTKIPVAGVVWQTIHYLVGFQRLGFESYYVEAHARTPGMLMRAEGDDSALLAAGFVHETLSRFGLDGRWAYQALHNDHRVYGMTERELRRLYSSADLIINLHGGTEPRPEHYETGRLVYLETDPVQLQLELRWKKQWTIDFLDHHCAFFTFGENIGNADCELPSPKQFQFLPTRQPVVIDFWPNKQTSDNGRFTTVANWRQGWRNVKFRGELYTWSKHTEFLKIIELPGQTSQSLEIALSRCPDEDKNMLEEKGWKTRRALDFSLDIDSYAQYIASSRGEFTVAKDQNVRLRSGWFSDRSATYLAAGRPVVTQETGFSNALPVGAGLFAFLTIEEILGALDAINSDYELHRRAAREIACNYFSHDLVLGRLLRACDCRRPRKFRPMTEPSIATL